MAHEVGFGAAYDLVLAATLYRKACDLGSGWGCFNAAGVSDDKAEKRVRLERSCDLGFGKGCGILAERLADGTYGPDATHAREVYQRACDLGAGASCHALAMHYDVGDRVVDQDQARTVALLERACELEHMESCFLLGASFLDGNAEVAKDPTRGLGLLTKACGTLPLGKVDIDKMPSGEACQLLAAHAEPPRARELLSRACEFGTDDACYAIAERLASGSDGLPLDPERSLSFLRYTCDQREAHLITPPVVFRACAEAGARLRTRDPETAAQLLLIACEHENAEGCGHLARAYQRGEGLAQDAALASKARTDACRLGYKPACDYIRCSITLGCDPSD